MASPYFCKKNTSELIVHHLCHLNFTIALKKAKSLWDMLVNGSVSQTGPQLSTRVIKYKGAVRPFNENSFLALLCLTTGHAFELDRASAIGKAIIR